MTLRGPASRRHGRPDAPRTDRSPRSAALDGLRALAVGGVMAYHAGVGWLPGGLLGVDTFFVLSGFLITGLLLAEHRRTGRLDLGAFWAARARRLLPGLLLVLVAVAGYVRWLAPPSLDGRSVRWDALAALGYVANWRFAFSDQSYFAHFAAPSPLLHLWSLGVEEQFYALWPLLLAVALGSRAVADRRGGHRAAGGHRAPGRANGRRGAAAAQGAGPDTRPDGEADTRRAAERRRLLTVALAGAAASTGLMAALATAGVDDSRIYYGTDTRAAALLVGAALAAWAAGRHDPLPRTAATGLAAAGLAATAVGWTLLHGEDPALYRGGFLLVALASAAVVAGVTSRPDTWPARLLALPPLPYLGRISYGLYLWHWPVFLSLTHARTGLTGPALLAVRFGVAFALAAVSRAVVEEPIRRRRVRLPKPRLAVPAVVAAVVAALVSTPAGAGASPAGGTGLAALPHLTERQLAGGPLTGGAPKAGAAPHAGEPVRVMLSGDSVALTLGLALIPQLPRWGVFLIDNAKTGCSIAPGKGLPEGYGNFWEPDYCGTVENKLWPNDMAAFHPAVTALLIGRWETLNRRLPDGTVSHLGEPEYDRLFVANLDHAVAILGHGHTPVALLTSPCFDGPEKPDGGRYAQDDPTRVVRLNELLREEAGRHPGWVHVIDLDATVCPGGQYHARMDGIPLRLGDGTHFDPKAGPILAPAVLPQLRALAGRPAHPRAA